MVRVVAFFFLLGLAYLAIKAAILVAVIVCLLRWPKETISVLVAIFLINLVGRYPVAAGIPVGVVLLVGICIVLLKPDPHR
ncbi:MULTISPECIES: hypothetical protein [Sphingobium]|uniref:Uncharacterized protein n=1 Tax=Sphingobium fuliginis ATCC 27551 TaxID=1208342 RepID=A0A5B8CLF8_SPHSA|nr:MULTISPECIES: hypothetical protein [Sphingobium]OAP29909.1 hypothetical protein A8O16_21010 [Sphingobium sp. 20006FA]KXU30229.1 hypothetical protein AXW74_18645 [Sphingobium sp. AM]KYC30318.1 hypothetical protein A0J57_21035 [Sphingobium sp. 22B]MCB4862732.1 hypothetical protein [Sphingobium sp. PNB]QDC37891.1 hypothetical protein FIL70_12245 [Sphingobium fuliginis ATCC 27551]